MAPIRKMLIVGGGTAGWMTAAWFSRSRQLPLEITLVESDDIGTVGVGEATVPSFRRFNDIVGVNEDEMMRDTRATFKLAVEFVDWGAVGERYYHPFGSNGRRYNGFPFHLVWLDSLLQGAGIPLSAYNLQALACDHARFMRPMGENSPLADITYALQFDASLYARFLRRLSEGRGVKRVEGKITQVQHRDDGFVDAVVLDNGQRLEADLFVDCSGFRSLLVGDAFKTPFIDWSHWLPCDRAVFTPSENHGPLLPYTRATAHTAGWQWRIPLQHRIGNGHVYASAFISDEEATRTLLDNLDGHALAEPRFLRFRAGRRRDFWVKNCVAIGLSSGFLEPLESTSIYLIQGAIGRLQTLFPDMSFAQGEIDTFNRETIREIEDIRDFLILHYKLTRRDDSDFWNHCRTMDVPDRLTERMALYASFGRIYEESREQFGQASWLAVMNGQGLRPRASEPNIAGINQAQGPEGIRQWLGDMRQTIQACCDHMPSHEAFLRANNLYGA